MGIAVQLNTALVVFLGSGLGGLARWSLSGAISGRLGGDFPWGTLVVNVTGSFLIGLFATLTAAGGRFVAPVSAREFFMVGICGGYTTFSAFSLQTLSLADNGQWLRAGGNVLLSVTLCLAAVWLGHALALAINTSRGS